MNTNLFSTNNIRSSLNSVLERGVEDGQIEDLFRAVREVTPVLGRCRDTKLGGTISSSVEVSGPQAIESEILSAMISCGTKLAHVAADIDLTKCKNTLESGVVVTTNLSNHRAAMSSSDVLVRDTNLALWSRNEKRYCNMVRKVNIDSVREEKMCYSDKVSLIGYQSYAESTELCKALKLDKNDFANLPHSVRMRISNKLKVARGSMSRFTRLVIAFLYYIALETRGTHDVEVISALEENDLILNYDGPNLGIAVTKSDMCYVHCDRPSELEYLNFLLLISKRFPGGTKGSAGFFERESRGGKQEVFLPSTLLIDAEAESVLIMCDDQPAMLGKYQELKYTPGLWFSYIVNYAKSIQLEGDLDLAYSVACLMCFHDNMPALNLPMRKSQGEIFTRSMSSKNVENVIPNSFSTKEALVGAFCLSNAVACVAKDIVSNHLVATGVSTSNRTIYGEFAKGKHTRKKWYRYMAGQGCGDAMVAADLLDCLKIGSDDVGVKLTSRINPIAPWVISPIDVGKAIRYGFTDLYRSFQFDTQNRIEHMPTSTRDRTLSVVRLVGGCRGTIRKARNKIKKVSYDQSVMSRLSTTLGTGDACITKGGLRVKSTKAKYTLKGGVTNVRPQPEIFDELADDDDTSVVYSEATDSVWSDDIEVLPCCYSVDDYSCGSVYSVSDDGVPERKVVVRHVSTPTGKRQVRTPNSIDIDVSQRSGGRKSTESVATPLSIPKVVDVLDDIKEPERLDTSMLPSPVSQKKLVAYEEKFIVTAEAVDTVSEVEENGVKAPVVECFSAEAESTSEPVEEVYNDYSVKKKAYEPVHTPLPVTVDYNSDEESWERRAETMADDLVIEDSYEDTDSDELSESGSLVWDSKEHIDAYSEKRELREVADPTVGGIADEEVGNYKDQIIASCVNRMREPESEVREYIKSVSKRKVSDLIRILDVGIRETTSRELMGEDHSGESKTNAQILLIASTFRKYANENGRAEHDTILARRNVGAESRKKAFNRMTKEFNKELRTRLDEKVLSLQHDDVLNTGIDLMEEEPFNIIGSEGNVVVSETLLRYVGLSCKTMNAAVYGVMTELFMAASAEHAWWRTTAKNIGVPYKACRKIMVSKRFKKMVCRGDMHPGMQSRQKVNVKDSSIEMYADMLLAFGYKSKASYYDTRVKSKVTSDLRNMDVGQLRSWFMQRPKGVISGLYEEQSVVINEIHDLARSLNNIKYMNSSRAGKDGMVDR